MIIMIYKWQSSPLTLAFLNLTLGHIAAQSSKLGFCLIKLGLSLKIHICPFARGMVQIPNALVRNVEAKVQMRNKSFRR